MGLAEIVWNDVRRWNGRSPTPTMVQYTEAYSRAVAQMMILGDLFPKHSEDIGIALRCLYERHDDYRAYVATQLEGKEHLSRENTDTWYAHYVKLDLRVGQHSTRLIATLQKELFSEETARTPLKTSSTSSGACRSRRTR